MCPLCSQKKKKMIKNSLSFFLSIKDDDFLLTHSVVALPLKMKKKNYFRSKCQEAHISFHTEYEGSDYAVKNLNDLNFKPVRYHLKQSNVVVS